MANFDHTVRHDTFYVHNGDEVYYQAAKGRKIVSIPSYSDTMENGVLVGKLNKKIKFEDLDISEEQLDICKKNSLEFTSHWDENLGIVSHVPSNELLNFKMSSEGTGKEYQTSLKRFCYFASGAFDYYFNIFDPSTGFYNYSANAFLKVKNKRCSARDKIQNLFDLLTYPALALFGNI